MKLSLLMLALIQVGGVGADPWAVAHRGGARLRPENTLPAFSHALALGADAMELDIHPSADGHLMVIHDETLKRTFGREGVVSQMTREELQAAGVPTLQEVLDLSQGKAKLLIEIKHPHGSRYQGVEEALVQELTGRTLQDYLVISFDAHSLKRLHQLEPRLATGILSGQSIDPAQAREELGVTFLAPHFSQVNREWLQRTHDLGLKVNVWTVNEKADLKRMIELGCDAITSDRPDLLLELMGRAKP